MSGEHTLVYAIWFGVSVAVGYYGAKRHAAYLRRQAELECVRLRIGRSRRWVK